MFKKIVASITAPKTGDLLATVQSDDGVTLRVYKF